MIIWRGLGILVPIVFVITGLLVSWISGDPDTRLGNPSFLGWTALFSGIVIFLLGLGLAGGGDDKDEQGNPIKKKHDFFWIPVFVWGLVLGLSSIYFLGFAQKGDPASTPVASNDSSQVSPPAAEVATPSTRVVNFYNPTKDTLTYIVADEKGKGLIDKKKVAPNSYLSAELGKGDYLFSAYKGKDATLNLPAEEFAGDESKYVLLKDDKGSFYQRILNPGTPENDDYDEAWLVLDGKTQLLLVNVSTACDPEVTKADVQGAKWAGSIQEEYDPRDLVEPLYKKFLKDEFIKVVGPGQKLPTEIKENEVYYLLVPYAGKGDKNAAIVNAVVAARF
jgi:hypothetical protein